MNLDRLVGSATFRWAVLYTALFGVSSLFLISFIYWSTSGFMLRQTDATIQAEIQGLAEQYRLRGLGGLVQVINQRLERDPTGQSIYLLADSAYNHLAGNLPQWPELTVSGGGADTQAGPSDDWMDFRFRDAEGAMRQARGKHFLLLRTYHLLVARDVSERNAIQRRIHRALLWGMGLTVLLGMLGGVLMSRWMLRRIDAITRASRRIMGGDLSQRMPVKGADDEFDRLAENLNDMLERIERLLVGIRDVSDAVAHDLRTPLTRMRTRLEMALLEDPDAAACQEAIRRTIEEADGMLTTFNALLRIAQAEAGAAREEFQAVDLARVVADVADLYVPVAEDKGVELETLLEESRFEAYVINANPHLLAQALANLVDNAVKYTPAGGRVTIGLSRREGRVVLTVADSGPGVPEADRHRVFDRFCRLESSRSTPGSGLGLSLVAAVAQLHDAAISLGSNPDLPEEVRDQGLGPGLLVTLRFFPRLD